MQRISNVSCGTTYTDAATLQGEWGSNGGSYSVAGGDFYLQLQYSPAGTGNGQWTDEVLVPVGSGVTGIIEAGTTGIRFRSASATLAAVVSANLSTKSEPRIIISTGGIPSSAGQSVTGDYKISAQAATHADPAGGTWYLCDGSALPPAETSLIALVGANTPDARGRALQMEGPHANSGFLASDGLAASARQMRHGHSFALTVDHLVLYNGTGTTGPDAANSAGATNGITGTIGVSGGLADTSAFLVPGNLFVHS